MARTFRRQRQSHPISELNVTNLIDLGFTLLIIFMIATPLINQEQTMPMQLPITSKSPSQKQEKELFQAIASDTTTSLRNPSRPSSACVPMAPSTTNA